MTSTAPIFRRVYRVGDTPDGPLWITVELHDQRNPHLPGPELSICGVTGPTSYGNSRGGAGQNRGDLARIHQYSDGWNAELAAKLADVWERWHLNGMRAGSPAQEQWLRDNPWNRDEHGDHFLWARESLAEAGLQPDPGHDDYSYGTSWLYEALPDDVIEWLRDELPTSDRHPWGDSNYTRSEHTSA